VWFLEAMLSSNCFCTSVAKYELVKLLCYVLIYNVYVSISTTFGDLYVSEMEWVRDRLGQVRKA